MTNYLQQAKAASKPEDRIILMRLHYEEKVRGRIKTCRGCQLGRSRQHAVPWSGPTSSPIVFIGEAPGRDEDKEGVPFVGRAGRLLNTVLRNVGTHRDNVTVMNVLCCRPPKNRTPTSAEREACLPNFEGQLKRMSAWVGVLMGAAAIEHIRGEKGRVGDLRGEPFWKDGRIWIPTWHPAYVLRYRAEQVGLTSDVSLAVDIASGRRWWPPVSAKDLVFEEDGHTGLSSALDRHGWSMVYSRRLQDQIVVVADESVVIDRRFDDLPRYTLAELVKIGELGRARSMSVADLRRLHLVKQYLNGEVML